MVDNLLISFLQGLGIQFPSQTNNKRSFFLQLLKDQDLKDEVYYPWAIEKYQLPYLRSEFFAQFAPDVQVWESEKGLFEWDEGFLPLTRWEGKLIIGCVDLPEEFLENANHILVLCSILELEKVWRFYHSPQEFNFVEQFGIQPAEPQATQTHENNVENKQVHEPAADLLELSDDENHSDESLDSESSEHSESEEGSPEGLNLDTETGNDKLEFDLSVPPPKLSLTTTTLTPSQPRLETIAGTSENSPTPGNVLQKATPIINPDDRSTPAQFHAATHLKPPPPPPPPPEMFQSTEPAPHQTIASPDVAPPPPPPQLPIESISASKVVNPRPSVQKQDLSKYKLFTEIPAEEVTGVIEQIFTDYRPQNQIGFFGVVVPEKREVSMIMRSKETSENLNAQPLIVDQPCILNIVLRTQKPFYGKPVSNELNAQLYKIVNDQKDPEVIMVIPLIFEDAAIGVVGFISDESSYSLERLNEYEARIQKEFKIKLGQSISQMDKAS